MSWTEVKKNGSSAHRDEQDSGEHVVDALMQNENLTQIVETE